METAQPFQQRPTHCVDRLAHRNRLEHQPELIDVMEIRLTELGDDGTPMRVELHQALGGQVSQRLPHRCGADVQHGGQLRLHEPAAGGDLTIENRTPQHRSNVLVGCLPGGRRTLFRLGNPEPDAIFHGLAG